VDEYYEKDRAFFEEYADNCLDLGGKLINFSERVGNVDPEKLSDGELIERFESVMEKGKEFMPFMFSLHLFDEFLTEKFDEHLKNFLDLRGKTKDEYFEYQAALALPFRKIFILEEKEDLMKIAIRAKRVGIEETRDLIVAHTKKYSWMNSYLFEDRPFSVEDFVRKVEGLIKSDVESEYNMLLDSEEKLKSRQEIIMKEIKSDPDLFEITKAVQKFGFLRSFRVDVLVIAFSNIWNIMDAISKRLGIEALDIKYLDSCEIRESLLGDLEDYKALIGDRKKNLVSIFVEDQRYEISEKSEIDKLTQILVFPEEKIENFVKGTVAFPGNIVGTCKVLNSLEDMKKVEKGDIIVVSMTDPNYVPAMEKASAFVTDFGGILCHAAIVSREMKKPCIIGTKVATKTFKDGDKIEINSDEEIVRILERGE